MSELPTAKVCTHCGKVKHLTQYHPAKRGDRPSMCILCTDTQRELRNEAVRAQEVANSLQGLYS